jgi:hypothetical protein
MCQESFQNFWLHFSTLLVSFWLLFDNIGLPSAETPRPIGAELRSFASHPLPDSALSLESITNGLVLIARLASSDQESESILFRCNELLLAVLADR